MTIHVICDDAFADNIGLVEEYWVREVFTPGT